MRASWGAVSVSAIGPPLPVAGSLEVAALASAGWSTDAFFLSTRVSGTQNFFCEVQNEVYLQNFFTDGRNFESNDGN